MKIKNMMFVVSLLLATLVSTGSSLTYDLGRISAYSPQESPGRMSCGRARVDAVAVSRDLFYKNGKKRCGELVVVSYRDKSGRTRSVQRVIWDAMNRRFYRSADLYLPSYNEAIRFGIKTGTIKFY